jgi:hypothetical protein
VLVAGMANAGKPDIQATFDIPLADVIGDGIVVNPCVDPPQLIEDFEGDHHMKGTMKYVYDDDDNLLGWEGHWHFNHQGVSAVGYDIEIDENGDWVWDGDRPKKAVDEDGNFITTDYQVPGTYNWTQNLNENHKDGEHWSVTETFMCKLVSHGSAGNAMIHFNGHTTVTEGGQIDMYQDNYWCKCSGAGPDMNGPVDCDEFGDFCQEPFLPGGPR